MDVSISVWLGLLAGVLVMLLIDLLMHRDGHEITAKEAGIWSAIWVSLGLAVGGAIWWQYGAEFGIQYLTGYVIEKSLAIDNVFIWAVILGFFAIPTRLQHRVLFYGVVGALIFRGIFIALGSALISNFSWVLYVFGAFLLFTGVQMLRHRNEHANPAESKIVKSIQRLIPTAPELDGQKFFIRRAGKLLATPLFIALIVVEFTDIVFAVDSIPAIFAVTEEPFLVFASNALAILGLRAMYFLLADLVHRFIYLKTGLAFVLIWVGLKMILGHSLIHIPSLLSLAVVVSILAGSVVLSLRATDKVKGKNEN